MTNDHPEGDSPSESIRELLDSLELGRFESLDTVETALFGHRVPLEERREAARVLHTFLDREPERVFTIADVAVRERDDQIVLSIAKNLETYMDADLGRSADVLKGILMHEFSADLDRDERQAVREIVREQVNSVFQVELDKTERVAYDAVRQLHLAYLSALAVEHNRTSPGLAIGDLQHGYDIYGLEVYRDGQKFGELTPVDW